MSLLLPGLKDPRPSWSKSVPSCCSGGGGQGGDAPATGHSPDERGPALGHSPDHLLWGLVQMAQVQRAWALGCVRCTFRNLALAGLMIPCTARQQRAAPQGAVPMITGLRANINNYSPTLPEHVAPLTPPEAISFPLRASHPCIYTEHPWSAPAALI